MTDPVKATKLVTWPYSSWKTLLNLFPKLAEGMPTRIDRSVLGGSEGTKTQVLAALKFLVLVKGENNEVTPMLEALVTREEDRPKLIRELLEKHYPEATKLGANNGTTAQLQETFTGLSGDTLRKAMTFYLHAAKFAQLPISKHFKIPTGFTRTAVKRKAANNAPSDGSNAGSTTATPSSMADARAQYIAMLMEMAKTTSGGGASDPKLLDRIERLLGYSDEEPEE